MIRLEVQKYWGVCILQLHYAYQISNFQWEVKPTELFNLYLEVKMLPEGELLTMIKRRLIGAIEKAMKETQEWQTPEYFLWKEEQKVLAAAEKLRRKEEKEAEDWRHMCWAQSAYNIRHYGDSNPWR